MEIMDRQEARGLLDELEGIKSSTRATLYSGSWQWLVIWSVAFLGAGLTALVPAWRDFAPYYWLLAVPIAVGSTVWVSARSESRLPLRQRPAPYWIVGGSITAASVVASTLLPDEAIVVLVWVILGLGFAVFAWLEKVEPAAWLLATMAVVSGVLGIVVEDTFELYPVLALSFSAVLAGIIVGMRVQSQK